MGRFVSPINSQSQQKNEATNQTYKVNAQSVARNFNLAAIKSKNTVLDGLK
jgi:hypothetical protein